MRTSGFPSGFGLAGGAEGRSTLGGVFFSGRGSLRGMAGTGCGGWTAGAGIGGRSAAWGLRSGGLGKLGGVLGLRGLSSRLVTPGAGGMMEGFWPVGSARCAGGSDRR